MEDKAAGTYTYELPRGYVDTDGTVHKEATLREITGADQEAMLNPQVRNNPAKMLTVLLSRTIVKLGTLDAGKIDARVASDLKKSDRDFLILKLKEIDSGPDLSINVECPSCQHKFEATVDVTDFFPK